MPYEALPIYKVWSSMRQRCGNKNQKDYPRYGGRGITVCSEWDSFATFRNDMGVQYERGLQLDRVDNNAGYSASNCRWTTPKAQSRNRRSNVIVSHGGLSMCLAAWAEHLGVRTDTLWRRIHKLNMPLDKALQPGDLR
jgi:hypothetical protein